MDEGGKRMIKSKLLLGLATEMRKSPRLGETMPA